MRPDHKESQQLNHRECFQPIRERSLPATARTQNTLAGRSQRIWNSGCETTENSYRQITKNVLPSHTTNVLLPHTMYGAEPPSMFTAKPQRTVGHQIHSFHLPSFHDERKGWKTNRGGLTCYSSARVRRSDPHASRDVFIADPVKPASRATSAVCCFKDVSQKGSSTQPLRHSYMS